MTIEGKICFLSIRTKHAIICIVKSLQTCMAITANLTISVLARNEFVSLLRMYSVELIVNFNRRKKESIFLILQSQFGSVAF